MAFIHTYIHYSYLYTCTSKQTLLHVPWIYTFIYTSYICTPTHIFLYTCTHSPSLNTILTPYLATSFHDMNLHVI
uniref:Uncharacterized protein n=1 Tax=Arundo donax TaxID=35708 RepID=A0A0A9DE87_ARUDO